MKIATIIGARPQFIKAAVVSRAIAAHNRNTAHRSSRIKEVIIHSGQHYDRSMSAIFFEEMHIPQPNHFLGIHALSHGSMTGQMLEKIEEVLIDEKPDCVLVYGDTNTTLAGALAAAKLHIPVAHVEAGLRSFNRKMPEEINRVLTDHASNFLFCPTQQAVQNLANEGIGNIGSSAKGGAGNQSPDTMGSPTHDLKRSLSYELTNLSSHDDSSLDQSISLSAMSYELPPKIALVGDVMFDAVLHYQKYARKPQCKIPEKFILSTIHRAENTDNPERLKSIFTGINDISQQIPVILPLHPRTQKTIKEMNLQVSNPSIVVIEPVGYLEMMHLLENCSAVMTDSGGLQKEAFFFKKPCITLRDETEWVELVEYGFNTLAGAEAVTIYQAYKQSSLKTSDFSIKLYGDGTTGEKIIDFLIRECVS